MTTHTTKTKEFEACALNLERALLEQTLADVYNDDARSWHNFTNVTLSKGDALKLVEGFFAGFKAKGYSRPRYVEIRRDYTDKGFVQQHIVEATRGEQIFRMPACLIIEVSNGRISRQYEYLDPTPYLRLMEQTE